MHLTTHRIVKFYRQCWTLMVRRGIRAGLVKGQSEAVRAPLLRRPPHPWPIAPHLTGRPLAPRQADCPCLPRPVALTHPLARGVSRTWGPCPGLVHANPDPATGSPAVPWLPVLPAPPPRTPACSPTAQQRPCPGPAHLAPGLVLRPYPAPRLNTATPERDSGYPPVLYSPGAPDIKISPMPFFFPQQSLVKNTPPDGTQGSKISNQFSAWGKPERTYSWTA